MKRLMRRPKLLWPCFGTAEPAIYKPFLMSLVIDSQLGGPVRQPYLSYWPARLHTQAGGIVSSESIPELLIRLQIRPLIEVGCESEGVGGLGGYISVWDSGGTEIEFMKVKLHGGFPDLRSLPSFLPFYKMLSMNNPEFSSLIDLKKKHREEQIRHWVCFSSTLWLLLTIISILALEGEGSKLERD